MIPPLGLAGTLRCPDGARALVIFAHGSGSSRLSSRNIRVADALNDRGIATLLFDLLLLEEENDRRKVFDIRLLGRRLIDAVRWISEQSDVGSLPVGLFGASTGAAAALVAASSLRDCIGAVVSRGGRPDLAGDVLRQVEAPTLLIVGGGDSGVIELNQWALERLRGKEPQNSARSHPSFPGARRTRGCHGARRRMVRTPPCLQGGKHQSESRIMMPFHDRSDAGRELAKALAEYRGRNAVVLALPRGGVPVAAEVAAALNAPLDLILVRKIGVPAQPELAMGAVVDGAAPIIVRNEEVIELTGTTENEFEVACAKELAEIERRRKLYIGARARAEIAGQVVIVIDDGIATGATTRAALQAIRNRKPKESVLAVPVAPSDTITKLRQEVDALICLETPELFGAIGNFYRDFRQVSDQEVMAILKRFPAKQPASIRESGGRPRPILIRSAPSDHHP